MPLNDTERARVRRALGYVNVTEGSVLSYGIPLASDFLFIVEKRMGELLEPDGLELIREDLGRVEATRNQLFEAQKRLKAIKVGNIETNPDEISKLYEQLRFWSRQLADGLGVPPHVYSWMGQGNGVNIPVM